jgi:flagellar hook-associated protein 2
VTTTTAPSSASSGSAILTALNAGSGIDTSSLVSGLVSATYDPKDSALTAKETANTAKISQLATLSAGIDAFASALGSLISGGTLFTQPTTSDSSIITATAQPGSSIGNLSAQLEVRQTAQAQSLVSPYFATSGTPVGEGTLTLASPQGGSISITIDATNNSLAGIARTINATNSGVTASVVTDANGARLVMKGPTGAANSFTLAAGPNSDAGLASLAYGGNPMSLSGATVSSTYLADATTAPVGQGDLTLTTSNGTATLTIDASNDNLDGLAAAITGAGLGLTASVTTDANGSYLVVADSGGGTPSFTLTPAADAQAGLSRFAYGGTPPAQMTQAQAARDAVIRMDGVDITRASNSIDDVIDGVTLNLVSAQPGTTVTLGASRPTAAIGQAVSDFVAAFNELKSQIDTATASASTSSDGTAGALYGNAGIREMQRQLSRLSSTVLNTSGGPQTLAEIGVATNRDGTLSLDQNQLNKALATYPDAVEAMFNPTQHSSNPLITITSAMGATKPGTYAITNVTAAAGTTSAQGTIAGVAGVTTGSKLYASVTSTASGLVIEPTGDVASATITVDAGLGGALQAIRDALRQSGGVLDALSSQLTSEKTSLADQRTTMEDDETTYRTRLQNQFATMTTRVTNYKSIQSYLTQQIAVWTNKSNT